MEFLNDDPVIEHKIEIANNYNSCIYCGIHTPEVLAQCGECEHKFCNGISEFLTRSHILEHLKRSNHKSIKYAKKKFNEELYFDDESMEVIACGYCNVSNIFELYFHKDIEKKKIEFLCQFHYDKKIDEGKKEEKQLIKENFKKIIYEEYFNNNKNTNLFIDPSLIQIPKEKLEDLNLLANCDIEIIQKNEEIIQLTDPITQRFLNKVKDKYESSDDYYEIYKPLIYSEYSYVKRIYESKQEYPTELIYDKDEKILYFEMAKDFNDINFNIGKRLQFSEEPKIIEELFNITSDERDEKGAPITFTAAVLNVIPGESIKKISILPISREENVILNKLGVFIMRESFCEVPYVRMLKGLDSFNNEDKGYTSNLIHSQILGVMDKEQIKNMDEFEMKNIFNDNEFITKIENYGELNTNQIKCMKKVFSHSLSMIQGPPGTGKTFLASFIIYNIFKKRKDDQDRILVCAPSNSAADNIALYLLNLNNALNSDENNINKINESEKVEGDKNEKNERKKNEINKKEKLKILRVYSKVKEIMETNQLLIDISLHTKLNVAKQEYIEMKRKKRNKEEEEKEDEEKGEKENGEEQDFDEIESDDIILSKESFSKPNKTLQEKNKNKNKDKDVKNQKKKLINIELNPKQIQNITNNIIEDHDIVVSTCSTSYDSKLIFSDFKYILVDEATQCCEVECLLPIVHGSRHVVLIGDQKQLGPTILYPKANLIGMNISLFERMVKIYPDNYILLKKQYRMHEQLAKFPSEFFYGGKIKNSSKHKESKICKKILKKFHWPKKDIPIMFINTNNKTTSNSNLTDFTRISKKQMNLQNNFTSEKNIGKSYENELEADITIKILNMINSIKSYSEGDYNIGIITPYIGQKKLILEKLYINNKKNYFNCINNNIISIASVDSFQGKEKDFIIINTVRSNYKNFIGFLKDPRRLNVSLTRSKHGLIIIGDAHCLANSIGEKNNKYSIWRYLIKYYQDIGVIVDYNEGKNGKEMFKKVNILNKDEKLDNYIFQEYDYDGKCNRHNINRDYIDDYGYIKKKDFFHFIDDRDYCINNNLFYDEDFSFDDYDDYDYENDEFNENTYENTYENNENYNYNYLGYNDYNNANFGSDYNYNYYFKDYNEYGNYYNRFNEEISKNNDYYYNHEYSNNYDGYD